jgi:hypothetical protein
VPPGVVVGAVVVGATVDEVLVSEELLLDGLSELLPPHPTAKDRRAEPPSIAATDLTWYGMDSRSRLRSCELIQFSGSIPGARPTKPTATPTGQGSGPSSRSPLRRCFRSVFVNADEIAKQRWPGDPLSHAYDAARVASETRANATADCGS